MKKPPLIPTLIVIAFVILMTNLGFWQLRRANEKELLLELLADDKITQIQKKDQIKQLPQYANIELEGHFLSSPQLSLDNQINQQQIGYHVFTPFELKGLNLTIMVNRGWIAKDDFKAEALSVNSQSTTIIGKLNHIPQVGIQLGEIELSKDKAPQVITYFDKDKVPPFLHESLCTSLNCVISNKVLLLRQDQNQGFKRHWNPIIMPPSKHIGYAVQWFSMTLVLIVIFIYWVRKLKV
ncbi:MAG: SURF1 family protein [Alcanivoracaceae bacterium]|nr:SURF1 family protein [Alcanivoracaceae bacterium]